MRLTHSVTNGIDYSLDVIGIIKHNNHRAHIAVSSYESHGVSNHRQLDCLFNILSNQADNKRKHQSPKLLAFCEGNPPVTSKIRWIKQTLFCVGFTHEQKILAVRKHKVFPDRWIPITMDQQCGKCLRHDVIKSCAHVVISHVAREITT